MLDINKIPFSYFGSYFVVSYYENEGLFIRDIRNGDNDTGKIFQFIPHDMTGESAPYHCKMCEYLLEIFDTQDKRIAQFCFADEDTLYLRSEEGFQIQLELILQKYDHINCIDKNTYELHSYSQEVKMLLQVQKGEMTGELPWHRIGNTSATLSLKPLSELTIESYMAVPNKSIKASGQHQFEYCIAESKKNYREYKSRMPAIPAEFSVCSKFSQVWDAASYIMFANTVKAEGLLTKYAVYMSNNCMMNIWSWDHAFTSLALLYKQQDFAYEQFLYFKDFQDSSGIFPDFVNNKYMSFSCCKPPIHGFMYQILMREDQYFCEPKRLAEVYQVLCKLAEYWDNYRKHNNLYFYNHGNDSGWDNATVFAEGCPVITADLAAHLITLHDSLAEIASLHPAYSHCAVQHRSKAEEIAHQLVIQLWDGRSFVARKLNGEIVAAPYCLLRLLPILAAKYLPQEICDKLLEDLADPRQFTQFGFATERTDSPLYEAQGYWRGPIWAPSSFLLIAALVRYGQGQLAEQVARRFCQLCQIGGLAENFDAQTGEGLEDPVFAWTSSVFLFLANKLDTGNWFADRVP